MIKYYLSTPSATLAGILTAIALFASALAPAQTAQPPWKVVFDRAEFTTADGILPPDETAAWRPVTLPDEWRHTIPGFAGQGWYRIAFEIAQAPTTVQAVHIAYRRSHQVDYFVNGSLVGGSRDVTATNTAGSLVGPPVFITVPPSLLRTGRNVIHVRMRATGAAAAIHGLGRVTFGDAREVRKGYIAKIEQEQEALRSTFAMAFAAGLCALCFWLARPGDRVMLLLVLVCLSWAFVAGWQLPLRWVDLPPVLRDVLQAFLSYGIPPLAVLLCLCASGFRMPRLEKAVWTYVALIVTLPWWRGDDGEAWRLILDAVNISLLAIGVVIMTTRAERPLHWTTTLQVATLLLTAALISSELMRYLGWISPDSLRFHHFHVLVMIVGIGTAIFADHVLAVWRAEEMNAALRRRIDEKTREIEANHLQVDQARRERDLARERQRIITDMHDGLGASLISLLRYVQSNHTEVAIEQSVKEALQELRIAIDALEPCDGDLAAVLGNLRYRLEPLLEPTGVRFDWSVADLPRIEGLEPSAVFALQRIVLEAVANALKHSGARSVRLSARAAGSGSIEIRVEDGGGGFDPAQPVAGLGLANMRARAGKIGARLEIASTPGKGTTVSLVLPHRLPQPVEEIAAPKPDPRALQGLVPAPGVA